MKFDGNFQFGCPWMKVFGLVLFFFPSAEWRSNGGGDREREKCRERERERERERVRRQTFLGLEIGLEWNKLG